MIEIKTLAGITINEITEVFNSSFSDYFLPIKYTEKQMREKVSSENGVLELSVGAFENGKLIGFILHFIDKKTIYNGGTGVIPSKRGKSLTSKMYEYVLPILQEKKIEKLILEVITNNNPAIHLYKKVGFKTTRTLNCYQGKLSRNGIKTDFQIKEINSYDWGKLESFWDFEPTWQNSISTLNNLQSINQSLGIYHNENICGYLIYNPILKRIHQMAIDKNYRNKGLGVQLLNEVAKQTEKVTLINIDTRMQNMDQFLEKNGFEKIIQQFEMDLYLSNNS